MPSRSPLDLIPEARDKCVQWFTRCEKEGINVFLTCTYRPQDEQDALYEQGRSKRGRIVTWTRKSKHTARRAFDFAIKNPDGTVNWNDEDYLRPGEIGESLGLKWGGRWGKPDCPHLQLPDEEEG